MAATAVADASGSSSEVLGGWDFASASLQNRFLLKRKWANWLVTVQLSKGNPLGILSRHCAPILGQRHQQLRGKVLRHLRHPAQEPL